MKIDDQIEILMDFLVKEKVMSRVKKGNKWAYVQNQKQYDEFEKRQDELTKKMKALENC